MKIVQILRSPSGGIRKHVMDILKHFQTQGHQLVLITDLTSSDKSFKDLSTEPWFEEVKVVSLPIHRLPHHSDFKNIWQLFRLFREIQPDIVHGHGAKGGLYARVLGRRRSIYSPHGGSLHANYGALANYLYTLMEKILLPMTGRVLVESQYTFRQFQKLVSYGFSRIAVNYNGIDFPANLKKPSEFQFRVAALGLLRELKGFDLLIRAAAELKSEYPKLKVKICGDGPEKPKLAELIEQMQVQDHVELVGESETPDQVYEWANLVVVPSRYESFGLVALEAMAQGIPVVVAYTGGLIELVTHGETGRIFTRDSSADLAEVLRQAFDSWDLSCDMAERGYLDVKSKYRMEQMISGVEKTYNELAR